MSRQCTVINSQPARSQPNQTMPRMTPRDHSENRRLLSSPRSVGSPRNSPRRQEPVQLIDDALRSDMEQQEQLRLQLEQQQQQGQDEGPDIQIVHLVPGPNEDQEVRSWKMFAGKCWLITSTK